MQVLAMSLNETHDPELRSWVTSANAEASEFPIQNLPFGVFRRPGEAFRGGVAIGDQILDLARAHEARVFTGTVADVAELAARPQLNDFMAAGGQAWSELRAALSQLLRRGSTSQSALENCLVAQSAVEYAVPARIGDYTDFYTSIHHATAVGSLFRPDNPLLPNYKWVPIGYHGRSSSIGVSFQEFARPVGQILPPGASTPIVAPCARLDYELELGVFVGPGNAPGTRIDVERAEEHIFGVCLLNDWSARDIQAWEYQPLGPFLSKSFATTISPWIVTLEALAPYRLPWQRAQSDPQPLPYLDSPRVRDAGAIDIRVQACLETASMRASELPPAELSSSSFKHAYWTIGQMVAHHTVNGCNLQPGDLLGTGTQSGPAPGEAGSLLELSRGGKQPVALPNGEQRTFLQDGDAVIMRAHCKRAGFARIGFGVAAGRVLPAREFKIE
jgi:fumarylacetoacetase